MNDEHLEPVVVTVLLRPSWSSNPPYFARLSRGEKVVMDCRHSHKRADLAEKCGIKLLKELNDGTIT